jgi:hypothetical protein
LRCHRGARECCRDSTLTYRPSPPDCWSNGTWSPGCKSGPLFAAAVLNTHPWRHSTSTMYVLNAAFNFNNVFSQRCVGESGIGQDKGEDAMGRSWWIIGYCMVVSPQLDVALAAVTEECSCITCQCQALHFTLHLLGAACDWHERGSEMVVVTIIACYSASPSITAHHRMFQFLL